MTTHHHLGRRIGSGKSARARLSQRERLSNFLFSLLDRLLELPEEELQNEIPRSLRLLARELRLEHCLLFRFGENGEPVSLAHASSREGALDPGWDPRGAALSWSLAQILEGRAACVFRIPGDLPREAEEERAGAMAAGVKSRLVLPLRAGGAILGGLRLEDRRAFREWTPESVSELRRIAGLYAGALRRQDERARHRTAENRSRSLLAALPDPVVVLDAEGRVLAVNPAWTGFQRCEDCSDAHLGEGMDYLDLCESGPAQDLLAAGRAVSGIRSVLDGKLESFATNYRCERMGRECHYRLRAVPLRGEGGAVVVHTNITELLLATDDPARDAGETQRPRRRLDAESAGPARASRLLPGFHEIVGTSAPLMKVLRQVEQVAPTDSAVLILGETGTGKDLVALAVHDAGRRKSRPFVTVNCAALPTTLIESELFGYERGAFTGALARTVGRFEAAHGGSILLDEVGELPLEVQAKLLRVLQSGQIERLGSNKTIRVDVRLMAATNRNLETEVQQGRFRADLYYRLSVFPITVPPLRERADDIPLLVWHFISRTQGRLGRRIESVPEPLMRMLQSHSWPGNVRELRNMIERALILTTGSTLTLDPLIIRTAVSGPGTLQESRLDLVQRAHIQQVLEECGWKVAGRGNAAERLGLKRATLQFRMKKLGIRRPAPNA
jgi:transcriptional regulator with GAF, ATPase, and Fis domain